ncbi:MAG: asparagine synthase (glutamine-hydrolyzing) [Deltaproteobacteria bacterium]|nr:MAG: asparagine synthase (glutamine-hydrolyzing) [Deltaproteobacteria bacterium]
MCGICGYINHQLMDYPNATTRLERLNNTLLHRGPDQIGAQVFTNAGLAMCRLSVIDLATGYQPMGNEDGSCWVVHNGEIYNFMDLRRELESLGHNFRSRSDTEVVLHGYEQWGQECIKRMRGMFAFAIYERPSSNRSGCGRLFLARDRLGKKPLYYYRDEERFIFASEIKAILAHPDVPRQVNRHAIPLYLAYGYVPAPHTIFQHIYELPPGHILTVQDGQMQLEEYWDISYPNAADLRLSQQEIVAHLQGLLEESVRLRLLSDVPLGAFLSGGLDSTAIVAYMTNLMDQPVKTFAIGFEGEPSFDELEYARLVAREFRTDHHEFVVRPDTIDLLPKLVWHHDQPFADSSAIPMYQVSKLTREHVTVALTGDGGDELFAGYERFAAARLADGYGRLPQYVQGVLSRLLHSLPESTSYRSFVRRARRFVESAPLPLPERYLGWAGIFHTSFIRELLADAASIDPQTHFQGYFRKVPDVDPIAQLLYVNAKTYLPGDLLVKTDRMSMANSLEARSPFLDHKLLEFTASIPSSLKLRGLTTKYILKKALNGRVPRLIVKRKKHGFGVPVSHWFRTSLKDFVGEVLLSSRAEGRGYFRAHAVRRLIDEHQSGKRDYGHQLWALLTFEIWHQIFIDQNAPV